MNMRLIIVYTGFLLFLPLLLFSQKETSHWYFSQNQALDWNTFPPQKGASPIVNRYASATISDENGKLLLSTDGCVLYNENNQQVPGFKLLNTPVTSPDNIVIVTLGIGKHKKFYVFACDARIANTDPISFFRNDTLLYYTEIQSVNGKPDFTKPLIRKTLATNVVGALSASFTPDGRSAWLVSAKRPHFQKNNIVEFVAFRFSECGLEETKSSFLPPLKDDVVAFFDLGVCQKIKFSPDGRSLAVCNDDVLNNLLHLSFDPASGAIALQHIIYRTYIGRGAFLFSKDSKYLYLSNVGDASRSVSFLTKYDLSQKKAVDSLVIFEGTVNNIYESFFTMSQHANGRIFFVRSTFQDKNKAPDIIDWNMFELIDNGTQFTTIEQNFWKLRTDRGQQYYYTNYSFSYDPYFSLTNFTNFVESYFDPNYTTPGIPVPSAKRTCAGNATDFSVKTSTAVSDYYWDFGDGTHSSDINPQHLYAQAGKYHASLVVKYTCKYDTIPLTVVVDDQPILVMHDITKCSNSPVKIKAPSGFTAYQWPDGSHDSVYYAKGEGLVTLKVSNTCGSANVEFNVNKITIDGPNVFTPNNDGANDVLYFDNHLAVAPQLRVENRWGAEVFKDSYYQNNWDGGDLSPGIYYYALNYAGCDSYKSWLEIIK